MLADAFLEPMVKYINQLGWDVYSFDHEGGDGQYEFDFGYTDALAMADRMIIFRLMAKHVARTLGCIASFMPKPSQTAFGSGRAPQHQPGRPRPAGTSSSGGPAAEAERADPGRRGLRRDRLPVHRRRPRARRRDHGGARPDRQLLQAAAAARADERDLLGAGVSRLRLQQPHADAAAARQPALPRGAHRRQRREPLPRHRAGHRRRARRNPPQAQARRPRQHRHLQATPEQLAAASIERLPSTLGEAIEDFARSDFAREILGDEVHPSFTELKRAEWLTYNTVVGQWEKDTYLQLW